MNISAVPVYGFEELPSALFEAAGGKGGTLARLSQAGYPVPAGLVILPSAFEGGQLAPTAWAPVRARLALWRAAPPRPGQATAFAVRSSARVEDSAQASFAGEFESVLDVCTDAEVQAAIDRVCHSQSAARVRAYAAALGGVPEPDQGGSMAVIVQCLVPADLSGVLFTADPVSGSRARMTGSFVRGLGDKLVSGEADGEPFALAQPHGRYTGPAALRPLARQLFRLGRRLEDELGAPQDIEWASAGGQVRLLQARPITTLRAHNPATGEWNDSLTGDYLWTNTNFGEAVPDVMTPATWSAIQIFMAELLQIMVPGRHSPIGNIGGRFYLNLSLTVSLFATLGFKRERILAETEEFFGQLPPGLDLALIPWSTWALLKVMLPFGMKAMRRVKANQRNLLAYLATAAEDSARLRAAIETAPSPGALAHLWRAELLPAFRRAGQMMQAGTSRYENAARPLRRSLRRQVGEADTNALLSGLSASGQLLASLGPVMGLWQVAQGQLSREAFAAQYGHRGEHELELAWPRPYEDPHWIEQQLAEGRRSPVDVPARLEQQHSQHAAAWGRFEQRYPRRASSMRRRLEAAAAAARGREASRSELTRAFGVLRAFALRAGTLTGLSDDIFFLSLDEMLLVLEGDRSAVARVATRRAAHARYSALPAYPGLIRGRFDPFQWAADPLRRADLFDAQARPSPAELAPDSDTLTGYAGAAGIVEGRVRVLRSAEEGHLLQTGEVLVAATTNIGWTTLFPRAAAIITDVGAPLSHAAIVARELGLPAVVGCGRATQRLHTGDRVRVNGGLGTVEILERAEQAAGVPLPRAPVGAVG